MKLSPTKYNEWSQTLSPITVKIKTQLQVLLMYIALSERVIRDVYRGFLLYSGKNINEFRRNIRNTIF